MIIKIIFSVIAALVPMFVNERIKILFGEKADLIILVLSGFISFVVLFVAQLFLDKLGRRFNQMNKYRGQWIEEMTCYHNNEPVERFIGIGVIRYDRKIDEYIFVGKTYALNGMEKYSWSIDYFHPNRDDSMEYVCSVDIPGERSIGQITFYNANECTGNIWVMNGDWYRFDAHRMKREELYKFQVSPTTKPRWRKNSDYGVVASYQDCPEFVRNYSQEKFSPIFPDSVELDKESSESD